MLDDMKQILIYCAVAVIAVSCQVGSLEASSITTDEDIINYASIRFDECVMLPVDLLEGVLYFDDFLKLSDAEKEQITDSDYTFSYLGENTYQILFVKEDLKAIVNTGGKALSENGSKWTFGEITDHRQAERPYDLELPEGSTMEYADGPEKVWTFISAEKIHTTIREMERDGLNCWRVNASCNDSGINGITSLSQTSPEGVVVRQWLDSYITRYSVSGIFTTEIYDGQKKVDFCTCTFRPGFDASYQTGR